MGLTQNLGRLSPSIFSDASLNIGVGAAPSGSYKFEVTGTSKVSGVLTLGATISNGTYTYTLPAATGTLALTSALSGYLPLSGGTLTGALNGTSAVFSSTVKVGGASGGDSLVSTANAGTNPAAFSFVNTGGASYIGAESSGGGSLVTGDTGYDLVVRGPSGITFSANNGASRNMRITSGGDQINYGNIFLNQTSVATVNANATSIGINGIYYMNRGSGSGLSHVILGNGGNIIGGITSNTTNAQFNTSSDYRLKKDLQDFNALDILSNIKLYDFAWKLNDSRMYGVLAHELKEIVPYAVVGEKDEIDEEGNIKSQGVDYSLITPILAKAIQEQQIQIQNLQEQNQDLKSRLDKAGL